MLQKIHTIQIIHPHLCDKPTTQTNNWSKEIKENRQQNQNSYPIGNTRERGGGGGGFLNVKNDKSS